jgi:tRNA(Ile)-lysidine synthase
MIKVSGPLPHEITVACSGGVDSMAVLSFLGRRKTKPHVAYFHHGTDHGAKALVHVAQYCTSHGLTLLIGEVSSTKPESLSWEEWWRNERYSFLHRIPGTVVMAHTLDDCMEQWIFSSLHGKPGIIPYSNKNVVRPFRETKKVDLASWCLTHQVPWLEDESNQDIRYMRNLIRHRIMPEALKVNPGLAKVIAKKVREGVIP